MDLSFDLIYSDGGEKGPEDYWKVYLIALAPFALGFHPTKVRLFLGSNFLNLSEELRHNVDNIPGPKNVQWVSNEYRAYFWAVYDNAVSIDGLAGASAAAPLVLISGHGFHDFHTGGYIRYGSSRLPFASIGPGAVLTILDICSSPHAAAVLSGIYPASDPKSFKWKKVFKNPTELVPMACDKTPATWAFRVGFSGQSPDDSNDDNWSKMSAPIGDAVVCSVLYAVKVFVEGEKSGSVDDFFQQAYGSLRTGYLAEGTPTPKSYSSLGHLQSLIAEGAIRVNRSAFDCELFRRFGLWFLTMERALKLAKGDEELGKCLITFVIDKVRKWHEENPASMDEIEESREAWSRLMGILGPFRERLRLVELCENTNDSSHVTVKVTDDGILFESWAISCADFKETVSGVRNWMLTGSPFVDADASDSDNESQGEG